MISIEFSFIQTKISVHFVLKYHRKMKSVLFAVCFLFAYSQVEVSGECTPEVLVEANACFATAGIDPTMFTNVSNYFTILEHVCSDDNVIDAFLGCAETMVDKCKDDKALGIVATILSQVDFGHVKTATHKSCSHIEDLDGQEMCLEANLMAVSSCVMNMENELAPTIALNPNPSQAVVAELMCSGVTGLKKCVTENFASCGKASGVFVDFADSYLPKKPCS